MSLFACRDDVVVIKLQACRHRIAYPSVSLCLKYVLNNYIIFFTVVIFTIENYLFQKTVLSYTTSSIYLRKK